MNRLPRKVALEDGKVVPIEEYCTVHCPERYDSECFVLCWLEQALDEENGYDDDEDYDDDYETEEWDDEFPR